MNPVFRGFYTVDMFDCPPFQMFTSGDDPRAINILEHEHFEPYSMKLWCEYARTATCILDIGAHTGIYALAAAALRKDVPIYAFEPNPYTAAPLRLHKHLNGFANIDDRLLALSSTNGIEEIAWLVKPNGNLSSGSALVRGHTALSSNDHRAENAAVYTATLDSLKINPGARPLIKIDVEGSELKVFQGATHFLQSRPTIIVESFEQEWCDAMTRMLSQYHFALIDESGKLEWHDRLYATNPHSPSSNQLCVRT